MGVGQRTKGEGNEQRWTLVQWQAQDGAIYAQYFIQSPKTILQGSIAPISQVRRLRSEGLSHLPKVTRPKVPELALEPKPHYVPFREYHTWGREGGPTEQSPCCSAHWWHGIGP